MINLIRFYLFFVLTKYLIGYNNYIKLINERHGD